MVTAEEQPAFITRDEFERHSAGVDRRFDGYMTGLENRFDEFAKMIDRHFNRMMWAFGFGGLGIFAALGYIISRLS